jgi:hypothetical protein
LECVNRIPTIPQWREFVAAGHGASLADASRQIGTVGRINLKTAKALDLDQTRS